MIGVQCLPLQLALIGQCSKRIEWFVSAVAHIFMITMPLWLDIYKVGNPLPDVITLFYHGVLSRSPGIITNCEFNVELKIFFVEVCVPHQIIRISTEIQRPPDHHSTGNNKYNHNQPLKKLLIYAVANFASKP